ncbi:hypothetical protein [Streptomyces sp. NPDC088733]|uniref:hypothetical protein n=1 Tax=Streptomyces sp. NPDC088733 TaxID=3365880 RepID=UPI0038234663
MATTPPALDLTLPHGLGDAGCHQASSHLAPRLRACVLGFAVITAVRQGHRRTFPGVREIDGTAPPVSLLGQALAARMPFPTTLRAAYADRPASVAIRSGTVAAAVGAQPALTAAVRAGGRGSAGRLRHRARRPATTSWTWHPRSWSSASPCRRRSSHRPGRWGGGRSWCR